MARTRTTGSKSSSIPQPNTNVRRYTTCTGYDGDIPILSYSQNTYNGNVIFTRVSDLCSITDVIGSPKSYNPVTHEKRHKHWLLPQTYSKDVAHGFLKPQTGTRLTGQTWTSPGHLTGADYKYAANMYATPSGLPVVDWDSVVDGVGSNIKGLMDNKIQILVTLGEISKTIRMFKNPFAAFRSLYKSKQTLSSLARAGSSSWLEYRYGWSQLYRDVRNLANTYSKVRSHMQYLAETAGKERNVSRATALTLSPGTSYTTGVGLCQLVFTLSTYKRVSRFSVKHVLNESARNITQLEHWMEALGTTKVAEALWDLVPFSFVVDWFFHLNRLLDQAPDWASANVIYMGYSHKELWYHTVKVKLLDNLWNYGPQTTFPGPEHLVKTKYSRVPGFPPGTDYVGAFGDLSKTHIADGTALILQRL